MKKFLNRFLFIALAITLLSMFLTACNSKSENIDGPGDSATVLPEPEKVIYSLVLEADKTTLLRGEKATLSAFLKAEGKDDLPSEDTEYKIISGFEYATLSGNVLTVLNVAPNGAVIKVQATEGATKSNEITFTVSVPVESVSVSAGNVKNILAGQSIVLNYTVAPEGAQSDVVWTITEGADAALMSGNVLVVNANAVTGTIVRVKASVGNVSSEELVFTIGYPLDTIVISAGVTNVLAGTSTQVNVTIDPSNATNANYSLVFVNDCDDYASISGNVITVSEKALTGDVIEVKAVAGDIESNVIKYVVGYPLESLTATILGSTNVNPGSTVQLSATLKPSNATNGEYQWIVTEGVDSAEIVENSLTVKNDAQINTQIKVKAVAGNVSSNELVINVGTPIETLTITSNAPVILERGGSYRVALSATPSNASLNAVEWVVSEGADFISIVDGLLVVEKDVPAGSTVKFHAASGSILSNELSFTVGIKLESITISLGETSTNVEPGNSRVISALLNPTNASDTQIKWVIDTNAEYATISGGVITVAANAPIGAEITFHAEIGDVESNSLTITVGTPITAIEISTLASCDIVKGDKAVLNLALTPTNASTSLVTWIITEGSDYASISNNVLSISKTAPTGSKVTIKAVVGNIESNELEFNVLPTQEEINATNYVISLSSNNVTVDKNGSNSPIIVGTVYNMNFEEVKDVEILYSVTDGGQFLTLNQDGNNCSFLADGHGNATVTATISGTTAKATVSVSVIVPPEAIDLPEMFKERTDIVYSFSMINPDTSESEKLPFEPVVRGSALSCKDYTVTFMHSNGTTGDEVAVYENGCITFKQTGKVTVIVSSKSGSQVEVQSTPYNFDINEGYNVYDFVDLQTKVMRDGYNGKPINLVVLEKPVANYATSYKYGYDMVPMSALYDLEAKYAHLKEGDDNKKVTAAIINEILNGSEDYGTNVFGEGNGNRIVAFNRSLWINGNNHRIDASQMPVFSLDGYQTYLEVYGKIAVDPNVYELISVRPFYFDEEQIAEADKEGVTMGVAHSVKLYNIDVVGNCAVDFSGDRNDYTIVGCYTQGINVGVAERFPYTTDYYVDFNNITASQFDAGIRIADAVGDSKVSNVHAYNCYSNGIRVMSSIVKLENMTFSSCGAFAIEISPKKSNVAGVNENENTKVTIAGTIDVSENLNDGHSVYFENYQVMPGVTVPTIIELNVQQYTASQQTHLKNEINQFNFVSLIMINTSKIGPDPNTYLNFSEVHYPSYQDGGIIDISAIKDGEINTTHQFITMDVIAPIGGQNINVGKAIFFNMNYGK